MKSVRKNISSQRTVFFVGMDLKSSPNELAGKLAKMISGASSPQLKFNYISLPNTSPSQSGFIKATIAKVRIFYLIALRLGNMTWASAQPNTILHLLLPGRNTMGLRLCAWVGRIFRTPVVMSVLKNHEKTIFAGSVADCLLCYSVPSYKTAKSILPHGNVLLIPPTSIESRHALVPRDADELLFMAMPWREEDLERRGFYLIRQLVAHLSSSEKRWIVTILNRTGKHLKLLKSLKSEYPQLTINIVNDAVADVALHFSRCGMLLVPHLDNTCPDPALSTVEALHCGCPVITTIFNGYSSEISENGAGLVCETNAKAFLEAARRVSADNASFSRNAQQFALNYYSKEKFLTGHAAVYESL